MDGKEILNLLNFLKALSEDRRLRFEGPDCQVLRSRSDDHQQGATASGAQDGLRHAAVATVFGGQATGG